MPPIEKVIQNAGLYLYQLVQVLGAELGSHPYGVAAVIIARGMLKPDFSHVMLFSEMRRQIIQRLHQMRLSREKAFDGVSVRIRRIGGRQPQIVQAAVSATPSSMARTFRAVRF